MGSHIPHLPDMANSGGDEVFTKLIHHGITLFISCGFDFGLFHHFKDFNDKKTSMEKTSKFTATPNIYSLKGNSVQ